MSLTRWISILLVTVGWSDSVLADTVNTQSKSQGSVIENPYKDWSRAERWLLSKEQSDVEKYERRLNSWCERHLNTRNVSSSAVFHDALLVDNAITHQDPIRTLDYDTCRDLTRKEAVEKRQQVVDKFKHSVVIKSPSWDYQDVASIIIPKLISDSPIRKQAKHHKPSKGNLEPLGEKVTQ